MKTDLSRHLKLLVRSLRRGKPSAPVDVCISGDAIQRQGMVAFYQQFIRVGDLCFDVGANVGERTDIFLTLGARVVCVEPQPACVERLIGKYRDNTKVVVVAKGLAPEPGTMKLMLCKEAHTLATFAENWKSGRFRGYKWESTLDVPVTTLDLLLRKYGKPAFCKIDVEGYEYQVLQGLSSPTGIVSFEFTREFLDDAGRCMDHLGSLGYSEFNYALGDNLRGTPALALRDWTNSRLIMDAVANEEGALLWGDIYARLG